MNVSHPRARLGAGVVLIAALLLLGGCRVDTRVSVLDRGGGHGTVSVSAAFDRQALQALGGESGLAGQLSTSDLTAAGWTVSGPSPTAGGGATVTVSHGYSNSAEASRLLAEVAGTGPASSRPLQLTVSSHGDFFHNRQTISGRIDLTCGLSCFGDQGLQASLGNPNGVATAPLVQQAGQQPGQAFGFSFGAHLPGSVDSTNARSRNRSGLTWATPLGKVTEVSATSESLNTGHIVLIAVLGGLVVVAVLVALIFLWRRRGGKHVRRRILWPFRRRSEPGTSPADQTAKEGVG